MKLKMWQPGTDLPGIWIMSYKIDGVNVRVDQLPYSKNEAVFDNLVDCAKYLSPGLYEFFRTDWSTTISLVKNGAKKGEASGFDFYMLSPTLDLRLMPKTVTDPTSAFIQAELDKALKMGKEGLVLSTLAGDKGYKVKPSTTYDLRVVGTVEGKGSYNKGMLGAVVTKLGNVSSGFTRKQRIEYWNDPTFLGSIIEVTCTELTPSGAMRYGRFIRRRDDKNTENLEGFE